MISRFARTAFVVVLLLLLPVVVSAQEPQEGPLLTVAEKSDYRATARYDEVIEFCRQLAERSSVVQLQTFGKSVEGRELPLLVLSKPEVATPQAARSSKKLVLLAMANIHAGEVCGKEALLMLAREWGLSAKPPLLDQAIVLIAPIYNADGNERVSKDNRPGQLGPEQGMGQRANAEGLDLNRDHVKLESPEARALVKLIRDWDPALLIDCHTTNGSHHRFALTYDAPRHPASDQRLVRLARDELLPEVTRRLERESSYRSYFYGNFNDDHSRWETYPALPRYSTHYMGLRNRIGILSEAYAYASYKDRVLATREFVRHCLQLAVERREPLQTLLDTVRKETAKGGPRKVPLQFEPAELRKATIPGFVEEEQDGKRVPTEQQRDYELTYFGDARATRAVPLPYAYLLPAEHAEAAGNLKAHGVSMEVLREDLKLDLEVYRVDAVDRDTMLFQKHHLVTLQVTAQQVQEQVPAGTLVVRTAQPLAPLIVNLLEPESSDGLATWNFFDGKLKKGQRFPVLRVLKEQPMLTAAVSSQSTSKRRPLTFDALYGRRPPQLNGSPTRIRRWLDDQHFLQQKGSTVWKVEAETGRATRYNQEPLSFSKSLQKLPGVDRRRAGQLAGQLQWNSQRDAAVVLFKNDLYYLAGEAEPLRLTESNSPEELVAFSPDGKWLAFVRDYDLYSIELNGGRERRLTEGGSALLRNGKADWVYYEEINHRNWRAFYWSPDSRMLAFQQYDDEPVNTFRVVNHRAVRQDVETERYPLAGQPNPRTRLGIVDASGGAVRWVDQADYSPDSLLITHFSWTPDAAGLLYYVQDRTQRWLDVCRVTVDGGASKRLFREQTQAWVDNPGAPTFLKDGSFLFFSERDGWKHLYRYDATGKLLAQVTQGDWEVRSLLRVDKEQTWAYFQATRDSHLASNLYRIKLDGGGEPERLTTGSGTHQVQFNPGGTLLVDSFSDHRTPTRVELRRADGSRVRTLDTNPVAALQTWQLGQLELAHIPARDGFELPAAVLTPPDFDPSRKYPVWLLTYGGPHAPTLTDSWRAGRAYEQMLANAGIIVFRVDPRSASGRGAQSSWTAYRQLGVQELRDLEDALDWISSKPYVDADRIGISGHSYGGFLTAFAMTHSKRFAAGIAGAPVTDWRNYDTIYTERYMSTPQDNPEGYKRTSVVAAAENLHGRLLLIHGARDDNVHLSNSLQLADALQRADKQFEMMIYPGSRHGIGGSHYRKLTFDFICRTMLVK